MDMKIGPKLPEEPKVPSNAKMPKLSGMSPSAGKVTGIEEAKVIDIVSSVKTAQDKRQCASFSTGMLQLYKVNDPQWAAYFAEGIKEYDEETQMKCWQVLSSLTFIPVETLQNMEPSELVLKMPNTRTLLDRLMEPFR